MGKYILITGGEMFNKGAQSMTFSTVNEIKKRYDNKEVILLSSLDYDRSDKDKEQYSFKILPFNLGMIFYLLGSWAKLIWFFKVKKENKKRYGQSILELKQILEETEKIIDISGYALSSQWGLMSTITYLLNIALAKKYKIKMYLMPQSFGPFNYKRFKSIINRMIRKYMRYPELIFAREDEGYKR